MNEIPKSENVCSVTKENNLGYYRLHTIWHEDGFKINIASKDASWTGEMTKLEVENFSKQLQISPGQYMEQCKEALTASNGLRGINYAVEDGGFVWKKADEETGIKVKLGRVKIVSSNFVQTIQTIVNVALSQNSALEQEITSLNKEQNSKAGCIIRLENELETLTKVKMTMENDLYARFLEVLNSKKSRIAELEELAARQNVGEPGENMVTEVKQASKKQRTVKPRKRISKPAIVEPYDVETDPDSEEERKLIEQSRRCSERVRAKGKAKALVRSVVPETSDTKKAKFDSDATISDENLGKELDSFNGPAAGGSESRRSPDNIGDLSADKTNCLPSTQHDILNFFFGADSPA